MPVTDSDDPEIAPRMSWQAASIVLRRSPMTCHPLPMVVLAVSMAAACVTGPVSPSQPPPAADPPQPSLTLEVDVYVREYGSDDRPLAGATVRVNEQVAGQTDADGLALVTVTRGTLVTIRVDFAGYHGFSAEGTIWGPAESWHFWLEPLEGAETR